MLTAELWLCFGHHFRMVYVCTLTLYMLLTAVCIIQSYARVGLFLGTETLFGILRATF